MVKTMPIYRGGRKPGIENKDTPRASTKPTAQNIAWIAGFLEGEGCFGRYSSTERVVVSQVQREPLERLQRFLGGTIAFQKSKRLNQNDQFQWSVNGGRARGVMLTLFMFMSPKRRLQICKALGVSF